MLLICFSCKVYKFWVNNDKLVTVILELVSRYVSVSGLLRKAENWFKRNFFRRSVGGFFNYSFILRIHDLSKTLVSFVRPTCLTDSVYSCFCSIQYSALRMKDRNNRFIDTKRVYEYYAINNLYTAFHTIFLFNKFAHRECAAAF